MPVFDYKCNNCNITKRDELVKKAGQHVKCDQCKGKMIRLIPSNVQGRVFPANGVYLEHVSATGQTFHSRKEMRQFEKKNKMELHYLE